MTWKTRPKIWLKKPINGSSYSIILTNLFPQVKVHVLYDWGLPTHPVRASYLGIHQRFSWGFRPGGVTFHILADKHSVATLKLEGHVEIASKNKLGISQSYHIYNI